MLNDNDIFVYNQTKAPSKPRFKIGDIVYTTARQIVCGYRLSANFPENILEDYKHSHNITDDDIIIEPAVFGVVVEIPHTHTMILDSETILRSFETLKWPVEDNEYIIDAPDSGSIWYLPDEERRYFVKWLNKECRTKSEHTKYHTYHPLKDYDGTQINNISLHYENCLRKAPNFIKTMKKIADKKKSDAVYIVLKKKLNIDHYSTKGMTNVICEFLNIVHPNTKKSID